MTEIYKKLYQSTVWCQSRGHKLTVCLKVTTNMITNWAIQRHMNEVDVFCSNNVTGGIPSQRASDADSVSIL